MKIFIPYFICLLSIVATSVSVHELSSRIGDYFSDHMSSFYFEGDMILVWEGKMILGKHFSTIDNTILESEYDQYLTDSYGSKIANYLKKDFHFMLLKS